MSYINSKIGGIKKRIYCIKYGMFYLRNADFKIPASLLINGVKREFRFKDLSTEEFTMICIDDCYRLRQLGKILGKVTNIVDVGANQGMFLIAARQFFPKAAINGYEPNATLSEALEYNATLLDANVYFEAVMDKDCMVDLSLSGSDLATRVEESKLGMVPGTSLATLIERHGTIDILKMDCEGTEWAILAQRESWEKVKSLTLEYHLWGRQGGTVDDLFSLLNNIQFRILEHKPLHSTQGLILAVNEKYVKRS